MERVFQGFDGTHPVGVFTHEGRIAFTGTAESHAAPVALIQAL